MSGDEWWRTAVIYQVYIRSFADADGDGIGDLEGIRSRLPYLRDLGVDAVWVTPFYPSPMADGGYDVADYRDIDPLFGSLDEAERLVKEAHGHGLRLIVDLVPNHTSDRHVWFQEALAVAAGLAGPRALPLPPRPRAAAASRRTTGSRCSADPPGSACPTASGTCTCSPPSSPTWTGRTTRSSRSSTTSCASGWTAASTASASTSPTASPRTRPCPTSARTPRTSSNRTKRLDHPFWDRDEVHEVYEGWRRVTDSYDGDRMLVGEAWVATAERRARYVRPGELHSAFNFDFLKCEWDAAELRAVVDRCLDADSAFGAPTTWVLANHDVTREVTRYGGGETGLRRARAAALLMLALPGGAYVYQGEELGLEEVEDLPEELLQDPTWLRSGHTVRGRDGCRVPVPWTTDGPSLGFGPGEPWLPQPSAWSAISVQAQSGVAGSTLGLYREALAFRRSNLLGFDLEWLDSPAGSLALPAARRLPAARWSASPTRGATRWRCRATTRSSSPASRSTTAGCRPTPPPGCGWAERGRLPRGTWSRARGIP